MFIDVIYVVNLYYELKDVFGGINIFVIFFLMILGVIIIFMVISVFL